MIVLLFKSNFNFNFVASWSALTISFLKIFTLDLSLYSVFNMYFTKFNKGYFLYRLSNYLDFFMLTTFVNLCSSSNCFMILITDLVDSIVSFNYLHSVNLAFIELSKHFCYIAYSYKDGYCLHLRKCYFYSYTLFYFHHIHFT